MIKKQAGVYNIFIDRMITNLLNTGTGRNEVRTKALYILENYILIAFDDEEFRTIEVYPEENIKLLPKKDKCICGVNIKFNMWVADINDKSKQLIVGSTCIEHFKHKSLIFCRVCGESHINRGKYIRLCDIHKNDPAYIDIKFLPRSCRTCKTLVNSIMDIPFCKQCSLKSICKFCFDYKKPFFKKNNEIGCRKCAHESCLNCHKELKKCACKKCTVCNQNLVFERDIKKGGHLWCLYSTCSASRCMELAKKPHQLCYRCYKS